MTGIVANHRRRRGSVAVAVLLVLLLVGLFMVGIVSGTARDLDLSARRLESVRAFYAAEAGVNMAVRELMINTDEDGDGTVGSISDDADDATDPAIGNARVQVSVTIAGPPRTLVSSGRDGAARREITTMVE